MGVGVRTEQDRGGRNVSLWFLVVRFAVSGVLALAIAWVLRVPFPRTRAEWLAVAGYGVLGNALYLGCTYEALRHMSSGVGAIVASMNPLVLALVAPWILHEPLTRGKIVGLALGFGGVVAIMLARFGSGTADPLDVGIAFCGVLASVASAIVYKRWCSGLDPRAVNALQLLAAGVVLLPLAIVLEGAPPRRGAGSSSPRSGTSCW